MLSFFSEVGEEGGLGMGKEEGEGGAGHGIVGMYSGRVEEEVLCFFISKQLQLKKKSKCQEKEREWAVVKGRSVFIVSIRLT